MNPASTIFAAPTLAAMPLWLDKPSFGPIAVIAAVALVIGGVLAWALLLRPRRLHRHRRPSYDYPQPSGTIEEPRRPRGRRRHHRPRNPTLAETGGLPPVRPEASRDDIS